MYTYILLLFILHIRAKTYKGKWFDGFMEFNEKDKIILESLFRDCRVSLKELSRRTNLTHSAILYRIRKYEREGLILKYDALINFNKFDVPMVVFFVRVPAKLKGKFEKYCLQEGGVMSLIRHVHKFNYSVTALLGREEERKLVGYFDKLGVEYERLRVERVFSFVPRIFDGEGRETQVAGRRSQVAGCGVLSKRLKLDEVDVRLMEILFDGGARESMMELARRMKLSADLIVYRIRRLSRAGYFDKFVAQVNPGKFGVKLEVVSFEVRDGDVDCEGVLERTGKCSFLYRVGKNKYIASLLVKSLEELERTLGVVYDGLDEELVGLEFRPVKDFVFLNRLDLGKVFG